MTLPKEVQAFLDGRKDPSTLDGVRAWIKARIEAMSRSAHSGGGGRPITVNTPQAKKKRERMAETRRKLREKAEQNKLP